MSTSTHQTTAATGGPAIEDRITHGAVHLDVTDLGVSLAFWEDVVGLRRIGDGLPAVLGAAGHPVVVLHPGARRAAARGTTGLYHLAVHVPDLPEFARAIARLAAAGVPQGPTDHVFSMATYATAPDGIGLEITHETPERMVAVERGLRGGLALRDADGRLRGPTEALDIGPVMAALPDTPVRDPFPAGTRIGHVHLHVRDLGRAVAFYRDVVGFDEHMVMTGVGMADLSAGGRFPHRFAVNVWNGPGAPAPAEGTARMRHHELVVPSADALDAIARSAARDGAEARREGDVLHLADPSGNRIAVGVPAV